MQLSSTPASNGSFALTASTPPTTPYLSPSPPAGASAHRYLLVLYAQPSTLSITSPFGSPAPQAGSNISLSDFSTEYGLGAPVAASWFSVQVGGANAVAAAHSGVSGAGRDARRGAVGWGCAVVVGVAVALLVF